MIKAAYNFVPIEDKYFEPDWSDLVSHDVPFKDGVSGTLNLKITANTPIFINSGKKNGTYVTYNDKPYIPGSTLKGAIRSVLEILSYGHLDNTRVQDSEEFTLRIEGRNNKVFCGWLIENEDGTAKIENCGEPGYLRYDDAEEPIKSFRNQKLSMFQKYSKYGNTMVRGKFVETKLENQKPLDKRNFYKICTDGNANGIIVFSGRFPQKKSEFVFLDPTTKTENLYVPEELYRQYKMIIRVYLTNKDVRRMKGNSGDDEFPEYTENHLPKDSSNRSPVFFTLEKGKIKTLGNVFLHKYFSGNTIYDAIPESLKEAKKPDLADLIFGSKNYDGIKGRVQFSHATLADDVEFKIIGPLSKLLESPKPSFYLAYLNLGDWNNPQTIAGRKRYPIKRKHDKINPDNNPSLSMTELTPIEEGVTFNATVNFHNLKRVELGALLSAITFHRGEECCHSIGQAKAYGYGNVSIKTDDFSSENYIPNLIDASSNECFYPEQLTDTFEKCMDDFIQSIGKKGKWLEQEAIKELVAMATPMNAENEQLFQPMELGEYRRLRMNDRLPRYTEIKLQKEVVKVSQRDHQSQANDKSYKDRPFSLSNEEKKKCWAIELDGIYEGLIYPERNIGLFYDNIRTYKPIYIKENAYSIVPSDIECPTQERLSFKVIEKSDSFVKFEVINK